MPVLSLKRSEKDNFEILPERDWLEYLAGTRDQAVRGESRRFREDSRRHRSLGSRTHRGVDRGLLPDFSSEVPDMSEILRQFNANFLPERRRVKTAILD